MRKKMILLFFRSSRLSKVINIITEVTVPVRINGLLCTVTDNSIVVEIKKTSPDLQFRLQNCSTQSYTVLKQEA